MKLFLPGLLLLLLTACSTAPYTPNRPSGTPSATVNPGSDRYAQSHDSAPVNPPDISTLPEPVPKAEPRSRYGNPPSYVVNGQTYYVLNSAKGYDKTGLASWYGNKFQGYRTSSGEPYDMYKFTAANRVLPLPSYALVTNLDNNKTVIVRVNDRGPFHSQRIIDLSWAAAKRLGITAKGTGRVRVQAIVPGTEPEAVASQAMVTPVLAQEPIQPDANPASDTKLNGLYLQLGAFREKASALQLQQHIKQLDNLPDTTVVQHKGLYKLWVGPFENDDERKQAQAKFKQQGVACLPVSVP